MVSRQRLFYREIPFADPLSVFEKVRSQDSFLLHSARDGRYSFAGGDPFLVFSSKGKNVEVNGNIKKHANPFKELRNLLARYRTAPVRGIPPLQCGAVGYFGYDAAQWFERLPRNARDDLDIPDCYFVFVDKLIALDHLENKAYAIALCKDGKEANTELDALEEKLAGPDSTGPETGVRLLSKPASNFTKNEYLSAVKRVKEYVYAGDTFQVNISQRFCAEVDGDPFDVYKRLASINPSQFCAFLDFAPVKIASSSPERLVRLEGSFAETRPIAGTRKRGNTKEEDLALEKELLSNEKELAEHTMLVDLARNDMGRVCDYGSVNVTEKMVVEKYSHVMHIVSNITGRLHGEKDTLDLLRAMFPCGTVTGCPKIRTMEIIDELEPVRRGPYSGSLGYISFNGNMDFNIIIRTLVIKGKKCYMQAGGGVVADSNPEMEYEETIHKAKALFEAIGGKHAGSH